MTRRWMQMWLVAGLAGLGGCGGGDDSPQAKCEHIGDTVCDRAVSCVPEFSGMKQSCLDGFNQGLTCSMAKSVGDSYDACIDQLENADCAAMFPRDSSGAVATVVLPNVCRGVVMTGATRAPDLTAVTQSALGLAPRGTR